MICCVGAIFGVAGLNRVAKNLPTIRPRTTLTIGQTYWVGAIIPPLGLPSGMVLRYANLYNKPGYMTTDPSITVVSTLSDSIPVKLNGMQENWYYVEATNQFGENVEGWLNCDQLLDYQPTPYPTPNRRPQRP
jgi:hypothetical protein